MYFQTTDISANLYKFGDLRVFLNKDLDNSHVTAIKNIKSTYSPKTQFQYNRTIVHPNTGLVIQLYINMNICEIVLRENIVEFKTKLFPSIIDYLSESIKSMQGQDYRMANEVGYKILLYVPLLSPASKDGWWPDFNHMKIKRESELVGKTILGTNLNEKHVRYTLSFYFDANYVLTNTNNTNTYTPINNNSSIEWNNNMGNMGTASDFTFGNNTINSNNNNNNIVDLTKTSNGNVTGSGFTFGNVDSGTDGFGTFSPGLFSSDTNCFETSKPSKLTKTDAGGFGTFSSIKDNTFSKTMNDAGGFGTFSSALSRSNSNNNYNDWTGTNWKF
jgi:hypothetical protein